MQLELFEIEKDNRIACMRNYIRFQIANNRFWFPTAKQLVEICDKFRIAGSQSLESFEEEAEKYCSYLEQAIETNYIDDETENTYMTIVKFYKNRLKKKIK